MGKIENVLKQEMLRLTKREMRRIFLPLRRELWAMKLKLSGLTKSILSLEKQTKGFLRQNESRRLKLEADWDEVKSSRFSPKRIRILRKKLGLSQRELAILTQVSIGAVGLWEKGKFHPSLPKKAILVALRKLSKRDVRKLLEQRRDEPKNLPKKKKLITDARPKEKIEG